MKSGVKVDTKEYDKRMDVVERGLGEPGLKTIGRNATKLLDHSAVQSISSATSPGGHPWEVRKTGGGWAPLQKTGQLKRSMKSTYKSSKTKVTIRAAVKPGLRSGGGKHVRTHGKVAGIMHYGRKPGVGVDGRSYGRIAPRRFLGLTKNGYKTIIKIADRLMGKG